MKSYQSLAEYEQYMTEGEKFSLEEINDQIEELTQLLQSADENLYQWYREWDHEQLPDKNN